MTKPLSTLKNFSRDEGGSEAVEAILLLAGAIIPLAYAIYQIVKALARYYSHISYVISLPF
jgi:Flp pilus assembly pilin Flp